MASTQSVEIHFSGLWNTIARRKYLAVSYQQVLEKVECPDSITTRVVELQNQSSRRFAQTYPNTQTDMTPQINMLTVAFEKRLVGCGPTDRGPRGSSHPDTTPAGVRGNMSGEKWIPLQRIINSRLKRVAI